MPDSIAGVIITIALILPGFVIAELSVVGRARGQNSDLELVLRALYYALGLHLLAAYWTAKLIEDIGPVDGWTDHLCALIPYVGVVLIALPVGLGTLLGRYLRSEEEGEGDPGFLYNALGGRDQRSSWDDIFQKLAVTGAWVIVELKSNELVGGTLGEHSAIGQSPTPHDLYLEVLWTTKRDDEGVANLVEKIDPIQGAWITADEIRSIRVISPPYASKVSDDE